MKKADQKIAILGVLVVALVGILVYQGGFEFSISGGEGQITEEKQAELTEAELENYQCPTGKATTVAITTYNVLNTTGSETFDMTGYYMAKTETGWAYVATVTDTTNPTATSLACAQTYKFCTVASNSDGGDNSKLVGIKSSTASGARIVDGCVEFTTTGASNTILVNAEQHDVLTFRLFDKVDSRYAYDTGDTEAITFEADGVNFTDGDNSTAFAVGAGEFVNFRLEFKGADADQDFQDGEVLLLVEGSRTVWDEAQTDIKFNGKTLTNIKGTGLTSDELLAYNDYEYAYLITSENLGTAIHELDIYMKAIAGVNPSTSLQFDFVTRGNFLGVDGTTIGYGAVDDTTSHATVYTVQDVEISIS